MNTPFLFGMAVGFSLFGLLVLLAAVFMRGNVKEQRESASRVEQFLQDGNAWRAQSADALAKIAATLHASNTAGQCATPADVHDVELPSLRRSIDDSHALLDASGLIPLRNISHKSLRNRITDALSAAAAKGGAA